MNIKKIKTIKNIIERQKRTHAIGIIYSIPKEEQAVIVNALTKELDNIKIKGIDAYTKNMLQYRLGNLLNIKKFTLDMLPVLEGKIVVLYETCIVKPSFNQILQDFYKHKIPLLILTNGGTAIQNLRELAAYKRVLTIEQDYNNL